MATRRASPMYHNEPESCDVTDFNKLRRYRDVRNEAHELLKGDEEHSIDSQLIDMFWRDATFRVFNNLRKPQPDGREKAAVNGLLAEFVDASYVDFEIASISRLTDPLNLQPGQGVVSLPTVIKLVRDHQALITREMFVCFDGLPFEVDEASRAGATKPLRKPTFISLTPHDYSEFAHRIFDRLSGRGPDARKRSDVVKPGLVRWLAANIDSKDIANVRKHRNKVLAHPADKISRAAFKKTGISLNMVDDIHKRLLATADMLSWILLGEVLVGSPIPTPQFELFQGLDRVFAFDEDLGRAGQLWRDMTGEREDWSRNVLYACPCTKQPSGPKPSTIP